VKYDPVKRSLGKVFNKTPYTRILFYKLLDLLLLRTWHIKKELRELKNKIGPEARVLDAGSGFGQYSYYLSDLSKTWKVTGVDVKKEQVEDCNLFFSKINKADQVKFQYADLTEFNLEDEFNLILSVDVMEHIEDDIQVFINMFRALVPGGTLLISTPSDQGGSDVHHEHEGSFIDEHVRDGYSKEDIESKLKTAGFSKIVSRYSYGKPGMVSWKLSMKYPIILLNFSKLFFIVLPFYYLIVFPLSLFLNFLDVHKFHSSGTGLIVRAEK